MILWLQHVAATCPCAMAPRVREALWLTTISVLYKLSNRRSGRVMVNTLDSGSSGPVQALSVVFLNKIFNFHNSLLSPGLY